MSSPYFRVRAGKYSFARHDVERFITDEETYWLVTNRENGERVRLDNFKQCCNYIDNLQTGATNE